MSSATTNPEPPSNGLRVKALRERHARPSAVQEELEGLRDVCQRYRKLLAAVAAFNPSGFVIPEVTLELVERNPEGLHIAEEDGYVTLNWRGPSMMLTRQYSAVAVETS